MPNRHTSLLALLCGEGSQVAKATADSTLTPAVSADKGRTPAVSLAALPGAIFERDYPEIIDEEAMLARRIAVTVYGMVLVLMVKITPIDNGGFPIPAEELIRRAKYFFNLTAANWPMEAFSDVSEYKTMSRRYSTQNKQLEKKIRLCFVGTDFTFEGPVVGPLNRGQLLEALKGFDFIGAFPDHNTHFHHFRVDLFEENRVWVTARGIGTNTGKLLGGKPSKKQVITPPQTLSLKFNEKGQIRKMTVGYVMDRSVGNTGGLGGIFGFLYAAGKPLPFPEGNPWRMSKRYRFFNFLNRMMSRKKKETN
eukprot:jgi/Bigna1/127367/aug1.4_g2075